MPLSIESVRAAGRGLLGAASLAIVLSVLIGGNAGTGLLVSAALAMPAAIGASCLGRERSGPRAAWVVGAVLLYYEAVGWTVVLLAGSEPATAVPGSFPSSSLWMLFGLGLVPLVVGSSLHAIGSGASPPVEPPECP